MWLVNRVEGVCFLSSFESVQAGRITAAGILYQIAGAETAKECWWKSEEA